MNKKLIDKFIGMPPVSFLSLFKKKNKRPKEIRSILVIRMFGVGDAVLVSSIIKGLKRKKKLNISVLCTDETKGIFLLSDADKIYSLKLSNPLDIISKIKQIRKEEFDVIIDTETFANFSSIIQFFLKGKYKIGYSRSIRSKLYDDAIEFNPNIHTFYTFQDLFSSANLDSNLKYLLPLNVKKEDETFISKFLSDLLKKEKNVLLIGIHPGTGDTATHRRWMPERFAELADYLIEKYNAKVFLSGTPKERELLQYIAGLMKNKPFIISNLSLSQFVALTKRFDLFISNDTGPMHIAASMGTTTLGLFGPNTPLRWAPLNRKSVYIYHKLPCSPCIQTHLGIVPNRCLLYPTAKCMELISVDEVKNTCERILNKKA